MKKLVIAALFVMGAVSVAATTVSANDNVIAEQEQKQEVETKAEAKCSGGSYGQETKCRLETKTTVKQSQKQKVLGASDVITRKVHVPVNTAVDTKTAVAAMSLTMIGGLAFAAKRKIA